MEMKLEKIEMENGKNEKLGKKEKEKDEKMNSGKKEKMEKRR
jgi:hypothetical protein